MLGRGSQVEGGSAERDPVVRVSVLGPFVVRVGDRPLARADWQRVSAERLVKLLLVTRGHRITREAATEQLWPDADPATGSATFRKALHYAHRALDGTGVLGGDGRHVLLVPSRLDLDLDRLHEAFATVDRPSDEERLSTAIEVILDLGAEDLLPDDPYEEWLVGPRERLRSRWQGVALAAARRAGDRGDAARALEILDRIIERDPTDEAAHRLAIELYARDGRHHAARRQFELCREALRRELDVEPSEETRAAFESAESAARSSPAPVRSPRLVARRSELEQIEPILDRVAAGRAAAIVLHGALGIGKTRLLDEIGMFAAAAGWRVAPWQATEATRSLAYAQTSAALAAIAPAGEQPQWAEPGRSAAAILRSGGGSSTLSFMTPSALLAGIVSAFDSAARDGPVVLVVDDLPWLDDASLEALRAILGALRDRPLLVAATCRDGEPRPASTTSFLEEVRRAGGLELAVGPLGPRDIEPLIVTHLGGVSVQADVARSVHAEGAGNPLYCLEIVQAARDRGALRLESGRWTAVAGAPVVEVPPSVQRLVASRSDSLEPATLDLLATAAELGPACTYATLSAVAGRTNGGLVRAIDEAISSGLLVERGDGYAFAHPLYRRAVVERAGRARRAATRLSIARALAGPSLDDATPGELGALAERHPDPVPVAEHALDAASAGLAEALPLAVAFGFVAGEHLARLFDRDAALSITTRALACWRRLGPGMAAAFDANRAYRNLGELHLRTGDDQAAIAAYRDGARAARDPGELADAYVGHAYVPYRHGDIAAGLAILEEGASRLPKGSDVALARIRADAAWFLVRLRRFTAALSDAEWATDVLRAHHDRRGLMRALDVLGTTLTYVGRRDDAMRPLEASIALALELPDPAWELRARGHLALTMVRSGEAAKARPHYERAIELASLVGDRYGEATMHWGAAEMEHQLGRYVPAADHRRREIQLLTEFGGNPHNEAMSHAHLAHLARLAGDADAERIEAAAARRLAPLSPEPGYADRIEAALAVDDWSSLET